MASFKGIIGLGDVEMDPFEDFELEMVFDEALGVVLKGDLPRTVRMPIDGQECEITFDRAVISILRDGVVKEMTVTEFYDFLEEERWGYGPGEN